MTPIKTIGLVIAGVVISVLLSGWFNGGAMLGGVYENSKVLQFFQLGDKGTEQTFLREGTCNLIQSVIGSHAATTSKEFHCAVNGVVAGDTVILTLPQAAGIAGSGPAGFIVGSSFATATDMIGASIYNGTGAATSSYTQATTSARYLITR